MRRLATIPIVCFALAILALLSSGSAARADTAAAGNALYKVYMEDALAADGIGTYTAATGPSHPVGEDENVLYSGDSGDAWSSYNTIRSYTTSTDYVQTTAAPSSTNTVINMDDYATVSTIGTTRCRRGPPKTPTRPRPSWPTASRTTQMAPPPSPSSAPHPSIPASAPRPPS